MWLDKSCHINYQRDFSLFCFSVDIYVVAVLAAVSVVFVVVSVVVVVLAVFAHFSRHVLGAGCEYQTVAIENHISCFYVAVLDSGLRCWSRTGGMRWRQAGVCYL